MKLVQKWMMAAAASFIVIGLTACGESATTENGSAEGGVTTTVDGTTVSSGVTGTYMVDMEAVRELAKSEMEAELEGATEEQRAQAETGMAMMEGFLAMFESWKLVINDDDTFNMSISENEELEGTWTLDGDQLTLTPTRVRDGGEWEPAEGTSAEVVTVTWNSETQVITMPMDESSDQGLIFKKTA